MNIQHLFKLKAYEKIEFLVRRHPIFLLRNAVFFLVLAVIPAAVAIFVQASFPGLFANQLLSAVATMIGSVYMLAAWLFFFSTVMDYYLDLWVVTNDRIIAVEQQGLFSRTISETDLWLVQDVTSEIKGIAATIFGFGKLEVQTASEQARFHFENTWSPNGIRQKILSLAEEDRKYHVGSVELKKVGL